MGRNCKALLAAIFLFAVDGYAQTAPSAYTTNYRLRKWASGANPSADSLNANWNDIDTKIRQPVYTKQDSLIVGGASSTPLSNYRFYLSQNAWVRGYLAVDSIMSSVYVNEYLRSLDSLVVGGGVNPTLKIWDANQSPNYGWSIFGDDANSLWHTIQLPAGSGYMMVGMTDTAAFSGSATRLAIAVQGAKATDKVFVTPRFLAGLGAESLPVAGDLLSAAAKTDSIIVLRAAGTTSGLKIQYTLVKR